MPLLFCLFFSMNLQEPSSLVTPVPDDLRSDFKLDHYYSKMVIRKGFPVVGSAKVSDTALLEAAYLIDRLLANRDDIRSALVKHKVRFGVLAANEFTTDMPEYKNMKPPLFWNKRARGLGATKTNPLVSCGEENLLALSGDPYAGENILIHEFAHAIHLVGLAETNPDFDLRLKDAFDAAQMQGLWQVTYAMMDRAEYWAEGVQSYFDCNLKPNPQHNEINNREKLRNYDPRLFQLVEDVFRNQEYRYSTPQSRQGKLHLAAWKADQAEPFSWPKEVIEWNKLNVGKGTIRKQVMGKELIITTSPRFSGAIESFVWNGREFLERTDHGRLMQSACSFDTDRFHPESYNPTEAGSRKDGSGETSSSNLYRYQAERSVLTSITQMAFWLSPGEKTQSGEKARNEKVLSNYWLGKRMTLGFEKLANVLDYQIVFTVPEEAKHQQAQFEVLTGYMPREFSQFLIWHGNSKTLRPVSDDPGEQAHPVIFSTPNGSFAMGIIELEKPSGGFTAPGYGRFRFEKEGIVKWNCVYRLKKEAGIPPGRYIFRVGVVFGPVEDVAKALKEMEVR